MGIKAPNNIEGSYYRGKTNNGDPGGFPLGGLYGDGLMDVPLPKPVKTKDKKGEEKEWPAKARKGVPSIFNRYSIFYFNSIVNHGSTPEPVFDKPNRLADLSSGGAFGFQSIIDHPTAKNIINWSRQGGSDGGTNAIEYSWEDFLWCKNYGIVPNNYMVTLRRFAVPCSDDLLDFNKQPAPDIGRMVSWVDGESNTWESVGLKFTTSVTWKELESEIQSLQAQEGYGNEGDAIGGALGNIIKQASWLTQPGSGEAARTYNPNTANIDPYANKNVVFGSALDVVKKMMVRDKGLNFEQQMTLKFEYELRSVDGINPKVAMMDLLSNVLICTYNRGEFWGGDIRYYGGNPRRVKPLGDTAALEKGDMGGYLKSLVGEISGRMKTLTGGAGLSLEGLANAAKNIGGGLMDNIIGGGLDKMGRPGAQAVNALLSGEDTGEWHVMVGNPANPIISVGNMVLEKTEMYFHGALGADDFPTKLTVTCTLKPARPRDRSDVMSMFHRNGRMYVSTPPTQGKYAGQSKGGQNGGTTPHGDDPATIKKQNEAAAAQGKENLAMRFPNHQNDDKLAIVDQSAQGQY